MSTTINGVVRYAQDFLTTSDPGTDNVYDRGATVSANLQATSATTKVYSFIAPYDGKLKFAYAAADVTSDGTKTYTFTVTNVTESATMVTATLFDADPVLTAGTRAALVVNATNSVSEGDLVQVTCAGGTGAGDATVDMVFAWT